MRAGSPRETQGERAGGQGMGATTQEEQTGAPGNWEGSSRPQNPPGQHLGLQRSWGGAEPAGWAVVPRDPKQETAQEQSGRKPRDCGEHRGVPSPQHL